MTARQIIVPGAMPSRDANGRALPAKFRFYLPVSGGTPTTVYTDNTLSIPHPFPILSDSAGRWPAIWADDALSFDVGWTDQVFDEVIATYSNLSPAADAVLASVALAANAEEGAEIAQTAAEAARDLALAYEAQAAASAAAAAASAGGLDVVATSASTNTIGTGVKTFTLDQVGKDFALGMDVLAADVSNVGNRMVGTVTAFADPILTVNFASFTGAGSHAAWSVSLTAVGGVLSLAGLSGVLTAAAAKAALAITTTDLTDIAAYTAQRTGMAAAMAIALGA